MEKSSRREQVEGTGGLRRELAGVVDRLTAVHDDVQTAAPGLLLYRRTLEELPG